jgi:hypothetical protein
MKADDHHRLRRFDVRPPRPGDFLRSEVDRLWFEGIRVLSPCEVRSVLDPSWWTPLEAPRRPRGSPHYLRHEQARQLLHNAPMESWFSTLKGELGERFESPTHAKHQLFDYIEVFYNQQRLHSAIGYASSAEFERAGLGQVA